MGLALALMMHLVLSQVAGFREEEQVAKPLTTQFIKRQPRLTKPLEMKKRPQPKRRRLQRKMVSVEARANREMRGSSLRPSEMLQSIAKPSISIGRSVATQELEREPEALAQQIIGAKESRHVVDLSLEMLDVASLNVGKYHAMVVQDPNDKRNIKGFFHLAFVPIQGVREGCAVRGRDYASDEARWRNGLRRLVQTVNKYTDIRADVIPNVPLSSTEVFKVPWLYAKGGYAVEFNEMERSNTGRYLAQGGFLFFEAGIRPDSPAHNAVYLIFEEALKTQNLVYRQDWDLVRLPNTHPIYHCFFDFNGPPTGGDFWNVAKDLQWEGDAAFYGSELNDYLEGYESTDGHLYGIVSLKNYHNAWADCGPDGSPQVRGMFRYDTMDPTRALQFGVNLIVFALTQEGSITQQVMNMVD
jgi:hypothetical protein